MSTEASVTSSTERVTGRVKWFNNKAGYGFITQSDGVQPGTDIFVHHSSIIVSNQQYRYLIQGEYVEFCLNEMQDSTHKFQASDVSGIKGGMLMCETRRMFRDNNRKDSLVEDETDNTDPMKRSRNKVRGSGPREEPM
jgi:cold shock protein